MICVSIVYTLKTREISRNQYCTVQSIARGLGELIECSRNISESIFK